MPRIVCISDTHGRAPSEIPEGDILIHAGDHTIRGSASEVMDTARWLCGLPFAHKVAIAGNHDWFFQKSPRLARELFEDVGVTYLQDEAVTIQGLSFYGSPWQPWFHSWAFNLPRNSEQIAEKWRAIPTGTDVVITHGPPFGMLDRTSWDGLYVGCERLAEELKRIRPRLHVFGHVHEGYGCREQDGIIYANASTCNLSYLPVNAPIVIDL